MKTKGRAGFSSKIGKRQKRRRAFKIGFLVALPLLIIGLIIFILRLSVFQISNIEVVGATTLNENQIKSMGVDFISGAYLGVVPRSNILFADTHKLEDSIKSTFGKIETVEVDRSADLNLKIKIKEKVAVALWCRGSECFLLDYDGFVYARASEAEAQGKIVFTGALGGEPIGKQLMTRGEMESYFALVGELSAQGIETRDVMLESGDKTVLHTSVCEIVVLPHDPNTKDTASNILLLIETERQKNSEVRFEYIDARFNNKMFYKTI